MNTLKKLIFLSLIAGLAFLTACEEEDENKLSYKEGKEELTNLDSQMASDLEMMENSEGMEAVSTLEGMKDPFSSQKSAGTTSVIKNIENFALPVANNKQVKSLSDEPFDFDASTGTYTWDNADNSWNIDLNNPTDKIIINFPADSNSMDNNNATLTIHDYEEVKITTTGSFGYTTTSYEPTKIVADLTIDGSKYVEIDLTASYNSMGSPESMDVSVYLNPFTFSGSMTSETQSTSLDYAIDYDGEQIFSTGISATFLDDSMQEPETVDGYVQYRKIKVQVNINAENLMALAEDLQSGETQYESMEELEDAINKEIDATVSSDGNKIADIELRYDQDIQDFKFVLVFNDGTEEDAEPYFDNFSSNLEELFDMIGLEMDNTFGDLKK